jgi:hypothetical protein
MMQKMAAKQIIIDFHCFLTPSMHLSLTFYQIVLGWCLLWAPYPDGTTERMKHQVAISSYGNIRTMKEPK